MHFEMANDIKKQEIDSLREQAELDGNAIDRYIEEVRQYKSALERIEEVATLDDVNCTILPETQNVANDVLKIVKEVLND